MTRAVTAHQHPVPGWADGVLVTARVDASDPASLEAAFDGLDGALRDAGCVREDLVRTRLLAASRPARDAASKVRFSRLIGPARCATSSYIDEIRFPTGDGILIEGWALPGCGATKVSVEYDPPQPPCRYVLVGDRVFLSGHTTFDADFADQVDGIRTTLAESLALAGAHVGRALRPLSVTAWVDRTLTEADLTGLAQRLGMPGVDIALPRCTGYSAPGKRIEVEVNAVPA